MKKIEAIIRQTRFEDVQDALLHSDIDWFEYHNVMASVKVGRNASIVVYSTPQT